ncbi:hypothetical protein T440DRAFT_320901 [Plenodomus tracheiphilus IPT5]|uniref:AGC-kinase C-terminal domain-containing protein n=1 Tax=Plenodomus tracheiphilus IPT5 TaxID=1408161 RepID=A0A6A7BCQ6_9PLEO|nr:hypothetical protein T440DRAFT_320901 [Plenodomus tracheiphilus IPT5]
MAPSNMFSYLRPGHAKRNASSLASPDPIPSPSPAACPLPSPSHNTEYFSSPRFSDNASYASASPISPFPPQLPPITRVASKLDKGASSAHAHGTPRHDSTSTGGSGSHSYSQASQDRGLLSPQQRTQHQLPPSYEDNPPSARPVSGYTPVGTRPPTSGHSQRMDQPQFLDTPSQSSTHLAPSTISPSYSGFSRSQTSLLSGISEKLSSSSKATSTPTPAPAKTKSRLNLRNPMSLLMRRRSGQALDPLADESLVTIRSPPASSSMPDNYDPSIRGNIVHDFNAPRLNRNYSYNNAYGATDSQQDMGRVSPAKIDKEHTPVFHEHFDDDTSYEQSQAAIRAETLVNTDFLARNSVQFAPPARSPPLPPAVPQDPPPPQTSPPPPRPAYQAFDNGTSILSPVQESPNIIDGCVEVIPKKRQSTKSPPPARSRATSVTDPSFQPAGLPAHFSSRASRFSFQIPGGSDSAQEKLLEERHKAKEAEKASKEVQNFSNSFADEYDEYDMDDYDMDGGYDEEIPMIGEEDEFEGLGNQTLNSGINGFDFSSIQADSQNFNDQLNGFPHLQQPLDMYGNPIGFAMSEEVLQQLKALAISPQPQDSTGSATGVHGLGLSGHQEPPNGPSVAAPPNASLDTTAGASQSRGSNQLDLGDDMYFDDGLIGDQEDPEPAEFDENVFDDPEGPLYERKVKFSDVDETSQALRSHTNVAMNSETGYEADDDTMSKHLEKSEPSLAHKSSVVQQRTLPTFDNMNAYHSALADAANRAEASGRFTRKASVDAGQPTPDIDESSVRSNSRPSLIPDDGRYSLDAEVFVPEDDVFGMSSGYVDDYDYSDFDSAMEDDPIIAAANAEALAYDDEGFYGQEFGFYASASGEASSTWGGFFGPSGLGRAPSGRNAVREPNLTPITERSEYSTRNSFISLNHFRDSTQPLSSPGLAQLARMSPYGWPDSSEDMSLDALMKLRKGAFGGSVASLPGSTVGSPRNSSPMGMQFIPRSSSPVGNRMKEQNDEHRESDGSAKDTENLEGTEEEEEGLMDAVNATYDDEEENEGSDAQERPESPTLTASDYNSLSSPTGHSVGNEAPLLPPISELYAQHNSQFGSNTSLPLSPGGLNLTSAANVTLPMSPYGVPLSSPYVTQKRPPAPPSIDTSLSSPTAGTSNSTGPRRQSVGFISPISNSSPLTPSGSGWRAGHSRKGSAADSVTYVREHDQSGEGRWVLERRRTAESGELELIGREIVEGGRI